MSKEARFWDKVAKKYAKSPIKNVEAYNQTMERTKAHLTKVDAVLEVGCGTGSTALLLAHSAKQITASDISGTMIKIATQKATEQQIENVSFVRSSALNEAMEPESFDVVLAFNLLHLLEDLPTTVHRMNTLLKTGGIFISKTVCLAEKGWHIRVIIRLMRIFGFAPYVGFLKAKELENLIAREGFEVLETGSYPASPPSRFIVARKK
ncbi:class I SAM-dependent methyltransferase [Pseudohalocynthiibacter aestuariivivens]|jgi:ubiquinone/menaquinone biosynthesis C-methylase UbiE|uniref:Class I SAM-dependent methyltransferase n=1 Tax=Pseudohalocynthiibacter aestuariivivens TaxID=1591409 RepID=A0ABV5JC78_9RHOB|nr:MULTISPECIES: class I SAM-dependent methyltransferase [Pseudohalocynthiibacter]MBS9716062.1 class I SAM-dependent methyltransferase [Pseudohalocynthiibacter aestuariivivens]MCK0102381.1 class I SAM-dependent methyltransferase [Pseudohalocynthiibacter sp. F2068]